MTNAQVIALIYGFIGFIVIGSIVLLPYALVQHTRHGRIDGRQVFVLGAFLLYACLAVAAVMLPLPDPSAPRLEQTVQLVPLQWIDDIGAEMHKYGLAPTVANALATQTFQQAALNVLLFVPLGMYLRATWRRGAIGATAVGAVVSLTIEIAQLTANFGTAPFVYRIFDVDDIMNNTVGALLGWVVASAVLALRQARRVATPHVPVPRRPITDRAEARVG